MRKQKTQGKKAKRTFAKLDREKDLKSAAGAVKVLRRLVKFAISPASWRSGLGFALEGLEGQLNDILLFSSSRRLPDELFGDAGVEEAATDIVKVRNSAVAAVKVLRKILKDAKADLSVDENQCDQLDHALDLVDVELNKLLPPPGSPPKARLPSDWFGEDDDLGRVESSSAGSEEMKEPKCNPWRRIEIDGTSEATCPRRDNETMTYNNEQYQKTIEHANQRNKDAVFDALSAAGITGIKVTFDGYGDSGQVQDIEAYRKETPVELSNCLITIQEESYRDHGQPLVNVDKPLPEVVEALCYGYLDELHGGWEIDDGSFGDFAFDVAARTIRLEYNGRITEVITELEEI